MSRGYARSRARTEAIQAQLEPLGPDERPLGLKLAVGLALLIAVANLIGAAVGAGGESPAIGVVFALFMGALALGMWQRRYVVIAALPGAARDHDHHLDAVAGVRAHRDPGDRRGAVDRFSAPVFWLLIRVMARLQVPKA